MAGGDAGGCGGGAHAREEDLTQIRIEAIWQIEGNVGGPAWRGVRPRVRPRVQVGCALCVWSRVGATRSVWVSVGQCGSVWVREACL